MENRRLKSYMMKFSVEELKDFLGRDLIDSLLEWDTGNEAFASKSRLNDIILNVHGTSILKNQKFRFRLIKAMSEKEISSK